MNAIKETAVPRHLEITRDVRSMILSGKLPAGSLMPTVRELAESFDTSSFTVHAAMTPLVKEGLIERKRRVGTLVKHNSSVLTCAGIYCADTMLDECEFSFYRELSRQLQIQLAAQNVRTRIYMDVRPVSEQITAPAELVAMIEKCEIQALFTPLSNSYIAPRLAELPVAFSAANSMPAKNGVTFDAAQMIRLALSQLKERGCASVGLIGPVPRPDATHPRSFRCYDLFVAAAAELGMKTREEWTLLPPLEGVTTTHQRYGYEAFKVLWRQDEKPEGLFAFFDTSARGVMTSALELGVRVPEDMKMVFHHNTGVDWLCPQAVDWVESDVALWAAEMIKQVRQQKAGKLVENVVLSYKLKIAEQTLCV